ncbi:MULTISPECIES: hypothetical protein [unclassified Phaeobacter]
MPDQIEIRHCGEVRCGHMPVGKVVWDTGFPGDFVGDWFLEVEPNQAELDDLGDQVSSLLSEISDLENELNDAKEDQEQASLALTGLQDEVRAFLAGGSFCDAALSRLSDALRASE